MYEQLVNSVNLVAVYYKYVEILAYKTDFPKNQNHIMILLLERKTTFHNSATMAV